jgi:hypothetical protein
VEYDAGLLSAISLYSATELFGRALETPDPEAADDIEVAKIPVPAAVWLFGSAVFGLLGMARQRHLE